MKCTHFFRACWSEIVGILHVLLYVLNGPRFAAMQNYTVSLFYISAINNQIGYASD
jgi:hypothetical protein